MDYTQNKNLKTNIEHVEIIELTDCSIKNILKIYIKGN